jgi:hypothetical protein
MGIGARAALALAGCGRKGKERAKQMRRPRGSSEGDDGRERKSRVKEGDVGEEGLYLCGGRGGALRGRESDGALYPIEKAAVSGCSDSEFSFTVAQGRQAKTAFPLALPSIRSDLQRNPTDCIS